MNIEIETILYTMSVCGTVLSGYFFRRSNLGGLYLAFLLTIPSPVHSLLYKIEYDYLLSASLIEWGLATIIVIFIWGLGYCTAWITEKKNDIK